MVCRCGNDIQLERAIRICCPFLVLMEMYEPDLIALIKDDTAIFYP